MAMKPVRDGKELRYLLCNIKNKVVPIETCVKCAGHKGILAMDNGESFRIDCSVLGFTKFIPNNR